LKFAKNPRGFEDNMANAPEKPVLKVLRSPREFCAGMVRGIESVARALSVYGPPRERQAAE